MFPSRIGAPPATTPATRLLVIEGDSIPAATSAPRAFTNLYRDLHPEFGFYNFANPGDHISDVSARSGWTDAIPASNPTFKRFVYAAFCGGNGFLTVANPGLAAYIQTYLDMLQGRRNAGLKAVAFTLLPRTTADFNAFRAVFNTTVRAGAAYYDSLCDVAADATMGPDSVCPDSGTFDPVWYSDGTHPTQAGHALLMPIFAAALNNVL